MKHKNILMSALIAGALCITSLLGLSIKTDFDPILANSGNTIVLNSKNGRVTHNSNNETEKTVVAKTTTTLNDVTFGYVGCSSGSSSKNLVQISSDGYFYNKTAITNINKITVKGTWKDEYLNVYISNMPLGKSNSDMLVLENGQASVSVNSDDAYFFIIDTELHSAVITEITIEYQCNVKKGDEEFAEGSTSVLFTAENAKYSLADYSQDIYKDKSNKYTFSVYGVIQSKEANEIAILKDGWGAIQGRDKYIGLTSIEVEIALGEAYVYFGPEDMTYENQTLVYPGTTHIVVDGTNNSYFSIVATNGTDVHLVSIKLNFDTLVPYVAQ